jgi:hypothetical protein
LSGMVACRRWGPAGPATVHRTRRGVGPGTGQRSQWRSVALTTPAPGPVGQATVHRARRGAGSGTGQRPQWRSVAFTTLALRANWPGDGSQGPARCGAWQRSTAAVAVGGLHSPRAEPRQDTQPGPAVGSRRATPTWFVTMGVRLGGLRRRKRTRASAGASSSMACAGLIWARAGAGRPERLGRRPGGPRAFWAAIRD